MLTDKHALNISGKERRIVQVLGEYILLSGNGSFVHPFVYQIIAGTEFGI